MNSATAGRRSAATIVPMLICATCTLHADTVIVSTRRTTSATTIRSAPAGSPRPGFTVRAEGQVGWQCEHTACHRRVPLGVPSIRPGQALTLGDHDLQRVGALPGVEQHLQVVAADQQHVQHGRVAGLDRGSVADRDVDDAERLGALRRVDQQVERRVGGGDRRDHGAHLDHERERVAGLDVVARRRVAVGEVARHVELDHRAGLACRSGPGPSRRSHRRARARNRAGPRAGSWCRTSHPSADRTPGVVDDQRVAGGRRPHRRRAGSSAR